MKKKFTFFPVQLFLLFVAFTCLSVVFNPCLHLEFLLSNALLHVKNINDELSLLQLQIFFEHVFEKLALPHLSKPSLNSNDVLKNG